MGGNQETRSQETLHGLSQLWEQTLGDPRIMIAVLDGPADLTHPALSGAKLEIVPGVVSLATPEGPAAHHGTHVSSIIFGQHGSGVDGVAPVCLSLIHI